MTISTVLANAARYNDWTNIHWIEPICLTNQHLFANQVHV